MQKTAFDGWLNEQLDLVEGDYLPEMDEIREMQEVFRKTEEDIVRAFRGESPNKRPATKSFDPAPNLAN